MRLIRDLISCVLLVFSFKLDGTSCFQDGILRVAFESDLLFQMTPATKTEGESYLIHHRQRKAEAGLFAVSSTEQNRTEQNKVNETSLHCAVQIINNLQMLYSEC